MASLFCPVCRLPLLQVPFHGRLSPVCPKGHGRILATSALRKWLEPEKCPLFDAAFALSVPGKLSCARCEKPMQAAQFEKGFFLEYCEPCSFTWIAEGKLVRLPLQTEEEIEALEGEGSGIEVSVGNGMPANLGLSSYKGLRGEKAGFPIVTIALVGVCFVVSQLAWKNHFEGFVFDPRHPWQKFGMPLILSLFAHANYEHLIGNAIFFFLPGAVIEATFGPEILLQLFFACGVVGSFAQGLADPTRSLLGASGAIAGIYAAVCVSQPGAKLEQTTIRWLTFGVVSVTFTIPVLLVFLGFLVEQGIYAYLSRSYAEFGEVGYFAHLGGAAAGLLFVLLVNPKFLGPLSAGRKKAPGTKSPRS